MHACTRQACLLSTCIECILPLKEGAWQGILQINCWTIMENGPARMLSSLFYPYTLFPH